MSLIVPVSSKSGCVLRINVTRRSGLAVPARRFACNCRRALEDMPHPILGHAQFQLPILVRIGDRHQLLPPLDRAVDQFVAHIPGRQDAIDGADHDQLLFVGLRGF